MKKNIVICVIVALALRVIGLDQLPKGLHLDEIWTGYNSYLLLEQGTNIYNEKWPLTMGMFGDFLPITPAVLAMPFIKIFGLNAWGIRLTSVFFSILSMLLGAKLIYQLTNNRTITLGFMWLYALSPWNIIMTRASSYTILDTAILLLVMNVTWSFFQWLNWQQKFRWWSYLWRAAGLYGLATLNYFTYFTSRLLIVPALSLLFILGYWQNQRKITKNYIFGLLPIIAFSIFPFLILLTSPLATGRFKQTSVINDQQVLIDLQNNIFRSGQVGIPPFITRLIHNKVTQNTQAVLFNYVKFLSPDNLLFQPFYPKRFRVPNVGAITWVELLGMLAAVAIVLSGTSKYKSILVLLLAMVILAAVPTALTVDDFPNFHRASIMIPFGEMAVIIGLFSLFNKFRFKQYLWLIVLLMSTLQTGIFFYHYAVHSPTLEPWYRNRAEEKLAKWINQNVHDNRLLIDNAAGMFLLPYFYEGQNFLKLKVDNPAHYFFQYPDKYTIANRTFKNELCGSPSMFTKDYDYVILYAFEGRCSLPDSLELVEQFSYDDGQLGWIVGKPI